MEVGDFFQDLSVLMVVAGLVSVVFGRFKWPKVIGYLFAGIVMSQHTLGGCWLLQPGSVRLSGEMGIVFLMFSMGMSFSFSEVKQLRTVIFPVALLDTVVMTWLGYTVGTRLFGWPPLQALFLGVAICDSATTMLAKVVSEMNWLGRDFAKYAMGSSVCEDILCVAMIAIVNGLANGTGLSLKAAASSLGGLALFFLSVLVIGLVLLPRLFRSVDRRSDSEALVLTVLGCLFFVSFIALRLDYSLSMGAFLVGLIAATSDSRDRLRTLVEPLQSMFAALFFISVGLLVNPAVCFDHLGAILLLTGVVVGGKFINCTLMAIFAGQGVKTALQLGLAMAQIGEFAFMVAILYVGYTGDGSSPMYQEVVAVSLITTVLNPFLIRFSDPLGDWVERRMPSRLKSALDAYRPFLARLRPGTDSGGSEHWTGIHRLIRCLVMVGLLEFAVSLVFMYAAKAKWPDLPALFTDYQGYWCTLAFDFFVALLIAPVWLLARSLGSRVAMIALPRRSARRQQELQHLVELAVRVAVMTLFFLELVMINVNMVPPNPRWNLVFLGVLVVTAVVLGRYSVKGARRAAERLKEALEAEDRLKRQAQKRKSAFTLPGESLRRFTLTPDSPAVGGTVVTLDLRARTGASIVSVVRGGERLGTVGPRLVFAAGDVLIATGESGQLDKLGEVLTA